MQISYGPPGQRGVTHLMAVGADEDGASDTVRLLDTLALASAGTAIAGRVIGSKTLSLLGVGGVIALLLARRAASRPRTVEVAKSASPAGYY